MISMFPRYLIIPSHWTTTVRKAEPFHKVDHAETQSKATKHMITFIMHLCS